jgi:hypothetical protein
MLPNLHERVSDTGEENLITTKHLEEALKRAALNGDDEEFARKVIAEAKRAGIAVHLHHVKGEGDGEVDNNDADGGIKLSRRGFLKAVAVLSFALAGLGQIPEAEAQNWTLKFHIRLDERNTKVRFKELVYWRDQWLGIYAREFQARVAKRIADEGIADNSNQALLVEVVRDEARRMERDLNAMTCWGQPVPYRSTQGACEETCQTFAQLHAPAGGFFCSPATRMVGWDIRILSARFDADGNLLLRMNVLITDKKYKRIYYKVHSWVQEGEPYPSPDYMTDASGKPAHVDETTFIKDLTLKVLRAGGTDVGTTCLDPCAVVDPRYNEMFVTHQISLEEYHQYVDSTKLEPSLYHLVYYVYGPDFATFVVPKDIIQSNVCSPADSPFPGANCETGCLIGTNCETQAQLPCPNYNPPPKTCRSNFFFNTSVQCTPEIVVTVNVTNCWTNSPARNKTFDYKYGYGSVGWYHGSFTTDSNGMARITVKKNYTSNGKFWFYILDANNGNELFSRLFTDCACPTQCCSDTDCPDGYRCVNGQCVPINPPGGNPSLRNVTWDTSGFCDTGFSVSGKLVDSDGDGAAGTIIVYVNGSERKRVSTDSSGNFNIYVPKSDYSAYLGCSNVIEVKGILSSTGQVTPVQSTTVTCGASFSITCSVDRTQVQTGESVMFSGRLSVSGQGCSAANQRVDIYVDGNYYATTYTDSQGRFSKSVTITCSSDTMHTIEARAGGATCSKQVSCVAPQSQRKIKVEVSYEDGLVRNVFKIWITEYGLQGFPSSQTIYFKEWTGATARVLVDRLEPYPPNDSRDTTLMEWLGSTGTISRKCSGYWGRERIPGCQYFQEACSHAWEVKKGGNNDVYYDIKNTLTKDPYGRPPFSDAQARQIIAEVNRLVSEIVHAWINDGDSCDKCSSYPCSSSASVTGDWTGKKYLAFSDITV